MGMGHLHEDLEREVEMAIKSFSGQYRFLSNFYPAKIVAQGKTWPSTEHLFQASKSTDPRDWERIRSLLTPSQAKRAGRNLKLRPEWDQKKIQFMYKIVKMKFDQHPPLKKLLLATGKEELIEGNNWGDTFWGQVNGQGQNMLGRILMKIRAEYKEEK